MWKPTKRIHSWGGELIEKKGRNSSIFLLWLSAHNSIGYISMICRHKVFRMPDPRVWHARLDNIVTHHFHTTALATLIGENGGK